MVYAYREPLSILWNVDVAEIPRLLDLEKNLSMIDEIIKPLLDDLSFAGTYVNAKRKKLIIYTVDFSKVKPLISLPNVNPYVDFLLFKKAFNPTTNLTSKFNRILELANEYKPVSMHIFNDVTLNNIVVRSPIKKRRYNNKFLKAVKPLNPEIEFFRSFSQHALEPQKRSINSLMLLEEGIHNIKYDCGLGFFAKNKTNLNLIYMITAGHCFDLGNKIFYGNDNREIGEVNLINHLPFDYGLINIIDDNIKPTAIIKNTNSTISKELFIKDAITPSSNGIHLCKSGHLTHVTCGNVISLDGRYRHNEDDEEIQHWVITDLYADQGESGSPMFSYSADLRTVSLSGIISGGDETLTGFTPVNEILERNNLEPIIEG